MESGFGKVPVTGVVYHLLGKTGWSTVVVNGTRRILNGSFCTGCARSISKTFSRKIGSKAIKPKDLEVVKTSK